MENKSKIFTKTYKNFARNFPARNKFWLFCLSKNNVLTKHTFEILLLSKFTIIKLLSQVYTHMTKIQKIGIPLELCGFDLLGSAKTGSGKTITFVIPVIEFIYTTKWPSSKGTAGLILTPTRELTLQNYYIVKDLLGDSYPYYSHGIVIGGTNKKLEVQKIENGLTVIIATPGRFLDHLKNNQKFKVKNLQILIVDEADRCLETGFEEEIYQIINILPKKRQTILFSATQTKNIQILTQLSFEKKPVYLNTGNIEANQIVPQIEQNFLICKPENRFTLLISLLKKNTKSKIVVFFNSCNEVKFFSILTNYIGIQILNLHGKQKQLKRTSAFFNFCKTKYSILFCTDVASRGLDIPSIDWIFQVDAPFEPKEYFHRIGRACRGINTRGRSLIFLLPSEINFINFIKKNKTKVYQYEINLSNWESTKYSITKIVENNCYLFKLSKVAFKSFLNSYSNSNLKEIFDIKKINLNSLSLNFGLGHVIDII